MFYIIIAIFSNSESQSLKLVSFSVCVCVVMCGTCTVGVVKFLGDAKCSFVIFFGPLLMNKFL